VGQGKGSGGEATPSPQTIAERRIALIEFDRSAEHREIREGDAVGPLVVSKIEPSGVVFVHEGVEVRRRIGE
jgi:hypothetical protein